MPAVPSFRPRLGVAVLMVALVLLVGLEAFGSPRARAPSMRSWVRHFAALAPGDTVNPVDAAFLETALDHSRQVMKLAELATAQASTVDVRSLAGQLAADERRLADQLAIVQRNKSAVGEVTATGPDLYSTLVQSPPAAFDRLFIRTVGRVHGALLNLFEQAASDARDEEIRAFAAASLPALRDHRNRLAELRKAFE